MSFKKINPATPPCSTGVRWLPAALMHAIFNKKNITLCQTACRTDVVLQTFEMNLADKKVGPRAQAQALEMRREKKSQAR